MMLYGGAAAVRSSDRPVDPAEGDHDDRERRGGAFRDFVVGQWHALARTASLLPGAARVDLTVEVNGVSQVVTSARPDRDGFAAPKVTVARVAVIDDVDDVDTMMVLRDAAGRETTRLPIDPTPADTRLVDGPVS